MGSKGRGLMQGTSVGARAAEQRSHTQEFAVDPGVLGRNGKTFSKVWRGANHQVDSLERLLSAVRPGNEEAKSRRTNLAEQLDGCPGPGVRRSDGAQIQDTTHFKEMLYGAWGQCHH